MGISIQQKWGVDVRLCARWMPAARLYLSLSLPSRSARPCPLERPVPAPASSNAEPSVPRNALNIVKDDLIAKVDELTG